MIVQTPGSQMGSPTVADEGGEARGGGRRRREKVRAIEVDVGVDGAKSEIKVERRCSHEGSAGDFFKSVIEITDVDTIVIVIVCYHSARADIGMPVCKNDILALHRPDRCQHQS